MLFLARACTCKVTAAMEGVGKTTKPPGGSVRGVVHVDAVAMEGPGVAMEGPGKGVDAAAAIKPALGLTWADIVTTRLMLSRPEGVDANQEYQKVCYNNSHFNCYNKNSYSNSYNNCNNNCYNNCNNNFYNNCYNNCNNCYLFEVYIELHCNLICGVGLDAWPDLMSSRAKN